MGRPDGSVTLVCDPTCHRAGLYGDAICLQRAFLRRAGDISGKNSQFVKQTLRKHHEIYTIGADIFARCMQTKGLTEDPRATTTKESQRVIFRMTNGIDPTGYGEEVGNERRRSL